MKNFISIFAIVFARKREIGNFTVLVILMAEHGVEGGCEPGCEITPKKHIVESGGSKLGLRSSPPPPTRLASKLEVPKHLNCRNFNSMLNGSLVILLEYFQFIDFI